MSEITLCGTNNFEMEKSTSLNKTIYMEEPVSLNENCIYSGFSKTDFSNLSLKEKAYALHYTPNVSSDIHNSLNSLNKALRSGNGKYPQSQWSNSSVISSDSINISNGILDELASTLKIYNDDVNYMIKDVINPSNHQTDLSLFDVEDFFKYSLIVGKKECSISEKLMDTLRYLSKSLAEKTQEVYKLQEQLVNASSGNCINHISSKSYLQNDVFSNECLLHLEEVTKQMETNKSYYQSQINDLLNEIRQRDELLDCYQKRENYLFNEYYPKLMNKCDDNNIPPIKSKENIINEMNQQLVKMESAFKEELEMKNTLINEVKHQKDTMEIQYVEELKSKNEMIRDLKVREKEYENEIAKFKIRSAAQVKLAEQVRSQIQSQQIEYCKKIEEMQQNLDSRGKIIAYVKNKLNIRENELKIANIKFTTAERQMNIEKDQYKREITNLKEELEKTNEDIEDLENELDTLEENLESDHKEELARLEKEHDFQLNKLWNIIDQRENTINEMEDKMEELKERTKSLEEALSKYEEVSSQEQENSEEVDEVIDDMNEKSNITMTEEASEEIILFDDDYSENSKISSQADILISNISQEEKVNEDEKSGLTTTEEQFDDDDEETNSLTLTEDLSDEDKERREFVEEEGEGENEEEEGMEREMKLINEENEQLKYQLDIIKKDNSSLKNQLEQEKENLRQENEKCNLQQQKCETLTLQYSQVCHENEEIKSKYQALEIENKKREEQEQKKEEELKQQAMEFQKEREEYEKQIKQLEETVNDTISKEQYHSLQKDLEDALESVNEQRRKKNYLKQKLANQHEKNKTLVELVKKERVQHKEEIRQLKQSCVKQNGKIKAVLKQMKDGLVTAEHIDLDRIVKRMKSERLLMNNEYERLKRVASTLSIKSVSKKQSLALKNEGVNELSLSYKGSRKDLNLKEGNVEIMIKNPNTSKIQNNESKILIKVASLPDESMVSKQANDSLNSIESIDENQELEEFSLKQALTQSDNHYPDDDDERNSYVDFTSPFDLDDKKEDNFNSKESISLILGDGTNKITQQQVNLYNRILQIPGVLSINGTRNFEFDDSNFSITSDSSIKEGGEGYIDKRGIGLEAVSANRIRYNSYPKSEYKGNNHASLRRMPNFDQIGKLTQIKIKHSTEEIVI